MTVTLPEFKPVDQDIFWTGEDRPRGNCLQAVVASLLHLDLEEVPHFVQIDVDTGRYYLNLLDEWLAERGLQRVMWTPADKPTVRTLVAVWGDSPRGEGLQHIVISQGGVLLHDPHPDRTGITNPRGGWWIEVAP